MIARLLGGLFVLLALAALADACPVVVGRYATYQAPYVAPVATAVIAAPVYVPTYVVSYGGSSTQDYQALVEEVRKLRQEVQALRSPGPGPTTLPAPAPGPAPKGEQTSLLAGQRCAACHDESTKAKGKGLVLVKDGRFRPDLPPEVLGDVLAQIASRAMPKGIQVPDAERLTLINEAMAAQGPVAQK